MAKQARLAVALYPFLFSDSVSTPIMTACCVPSVRGVRLHHNKNKTVPFRAGSRHRCARLCRTTRCVEFQTLLGQWRDSLGICICVRKSLGQHRLDAYFSQPGDDPYPLRKSITSSAHARFRCGHYECCIAASSKRRIVWVDCRDRSRISVWKRTFMERMVSIAEVVPITNTLVSCLVSPVSVDSLVSALSAALPEFNFNRDGSGDGCDKQQHERTMITDLLVQSSMELREGSRMSTQHRWDPTQNPLPPWRKSQESTPNVDSSVGCMNMAIQKQAVNDDREKDSTSCVSPITKESQMPAVESLQALASERHPWADLKKRKCREAHITAYGVALLGEFHSLDSARTPAGAPARSSFELSHHNSMDRSGMSV